MSNNKMITQAISAVLVMGLTSLTGHPAIAAETKQQVKMDNNAMMQMANVEGMEKCYGIAKAGMNDCGTASHGCSGEAKKEGDKQEWLFVPTGLCQKIIGGSTHE